MQTPDFVTTISQVTRELPIDLESLTSPESYEPQSRRKLMTRTPRRQHQRPFLKKANQRPKSHLYKVCLSKGRKINLIRSNFCFRQADAKGSIELVDEIALRDGFARLVLVDDCAFLPM